MNLQKLFFLCIVLVLLLPAMSQGQEEEVNAFYWADTVTVEGLKNLRIPTINAIATKMVLPLHSTPASVGIVTRPMFDSQQAITLNDALKNISGVNIQHGTGTHDFFLIRGFESLSGGLVLTDGAAEPEVSFYNLYNIDRVEVLKGPAAFLYGGNPLSGAVNLSRKQPVFTNFANVNGSYGEFNTFRGAADFGVSNEDRSLAFRLNGLWQDTENYRDNKNNSTYAVNPAFTWKMGEQSKLTANFEYVRSNAAPDAGLPLQFVPDVNFQLSPMLPNVPRTRSYQTPLDDSEQDLFRLRLDYQRQLSKKLMLRNKFYFTQLDWLSTGTLLNGAFPDPTRLGEYNVVRTLNSLDDSQKFLGNQLEALYAFHTGSVKHNLVAGIEAARRTDNFDLDLAAFSPPSQFNPNGSNLELLIDLNNPVDFVASRDQLSFTDFASGDARSLIFAPYFINQASLSDQVQLFAGGRFDVIDYEDDRSDFDFVIFQNVGRQTTRNYKQFSPMAGLVISPAPSLSLYANAGQSFRPPSTLVVGSPEPEESTQIEAGAKLSMLNGKLTSSLAVYQLDRKNIGIPDDNGVTRQNGDQSSKGVEFEIAVQPAGGFNAFLSYAYTDAELTTFAEVDPATGQRNVFDGNTPAFAPKSILNFWATKEFTSSVGVGAGFRYVGKQFLDEDNVFEIDDYLTVDASLFYTFRNFRWSVNVKNITDKEYLRRGGFGSSSITPNNPRAVYGSMSFSL